MLGMIEAADKMVFTAKGVRGGLDAISEIPLPAVAHVVIKDQLLMLIIFLSRQKEKSLNKAIIKCYLH